MALVTFITYKFEISEIELTFLRTGIWLFRIKVILDTEGDVM